MPKAEDMLSSEDHDVLITLVETVKQQHLQVMSRIEGIKNNVQSLKDVDLKELKDGVHQRVSVLEEKVLKIEQFHDQINAPQIAVVTRDNEKWINNFKISWKTTLFIVGSSASVVTFILTFMLQLSNLMGS